MVKQELNAAHERLAELAQEAPAEVRRELALVKTKIDEAELWLDRAAEIEAKIRHAEDSTAA